MVHFERPAERLNNERGVGPGKAFGLRRGEDAWSPCKLV